MGMFEGGTAGPSCVCCASKHGRPGNFFFCTLFRLEVSILFRDVVLEGGDETGRGLGLVFPFRFICRYQNLTTPTICLS